MPLYHTFSTSVEWIKLFLKSYYVNIELFSEHLLDMLQIFFLQAVKFSEFVVRVAELLEPVTQRLSLAFQSDNSSNRKVFKHSTIVSSLACPEVAVNQG